MPIYKHNYLSVVLLGSPNPVIINHDFLVKEGLLPETEEPFKTLLKQEEGKKFSQFFSSPEMTFLRYDRLSFMVERTRFQARDDRPRSTAASPIVAIMAKMFKEVLRYTPAHAMGINFNGGLVFKDREERSAFISSYGCDARNWAQITGQANNFMGIIVTSLTDLGKNEMILREDTDTESALSINFNMERKGEDITSLVYSIEEFGEISTLFHGIMEKLGVDSNHEPT